MLDEDIQLRAFQALKVDRNHIKLNLNQLSSLNKLESVRKNKQKPLKILFFLILLDNYSYLFTSSFWLLCIITYNKLSI